MGNELDSQCRRADSLHHRQPRIFTKGYLKHSQEEATSKGRQLRLSRQLSENKIVQDGS